MTRSIPVTTLPSGATFWVEPNTLLLDVFRAAHEPIVAACGGHGRCGTCGVRVVDGELSPPDSVEIELLVIARPGTRLACRARVVSPVTIKALVSLGSKPAERPARPGTGLVAAIDLGTTNITAVVLERGSGREIGRATVPNRQSSFGADVLSRVASAGEGSAHHLSLAAQESVLEALEAAGGDALRDVHRVAVAANTVMMALFSGADVSPLSRAPFEMPEIPVDPPLDHLRSRLADGADVAVIPPLAAFVGGDIAAGIHALNMLDADDPVLLVDMGTNAEVALSVAGQVSVASAPAGPAFEGVGVACGGPAVPGAVVRVSRDGAELALETLPGAEPRWLTGSGLISAIAVLASAGHVGADGRLHDSGPLSGRFFTDSDGVLSVSLGDDLALSQLDVRAFQLAKAAVRVAIEVVLSEVGVPARSLGALWVAGAFGGAVDKGDLVALGLVPASSAPVLHPVGNTALAGAVKAVMSDEWPQAMMSAEHGVHHVDLPATQEFSARLMRALELAPYDI